MVTKLNWNWRSFFQTIQSYVISYLPKKSKKYIRLKKKWMGFIVPRSGSMDCWKPSQKILGFEYFRIIWNDKPFPFTSKIKSLLLKNRTFCVKLSNPGTMVSSQLYLLSVLDPSLLTSRCSHNSPASVPIEDDWNSSKTSGEDPIREGYYRYNLATSPSPSEFRLWILLRMRSKHPLSCFAEKG